MVAEIPDQIILVLVVFVPDIPDDLLDQILHCDDSGSLSVFIKYDCHTVCGGFHLREDLARLLILIYKQWFTQDASQIKITDI